MNVFICRKTRTMLIRFDMINCGSFDSFEQTQEETRMSGRAWVLAQENDTKWKRFILCRKMANGMSVPNQCEQEIGSTLFHWMGWLNYKGNMRIKTHFIFIVYWKARDGRRLISIVSAFVGFSPTDKQKMWNESVLHAEGSFHFD